MILHNPKKCTETLKRGSEYMTREVDSTAHICVNLHGKIYELGVGETKKFPELSVNGKATSIGLELLNRYGFLKEVKDADMKTDVATDEGEDIEGVKEDEELVNPLLAVEGLGEASVKKLTQIGIITIEDFNEFKEDKERVIEVLGPLVARRINKE